MKKPAFSLIEVLISMSLMGVLISLGGQLYLNLQELHSRYARTQETSLEVAHLQHCLHQDLVRAEVVLRLDSVRLELGSHDGFRVSYVRTDSCLLRVPGKGNPMRFPAAQWKRSQAHLLELEVLDAPPVLFRLPIPLFPPLTLQAYDFPR